MNKNILFAIMILAGCEGRSPAPSESGDIVLNCPDIPAQDDSALVTCLNDLDEALDFCEEEPVPEPVTTVVCQANGVVVADASECPLVSLTCPRGTNAFTDQATGEFRCDEQHLSVTDGQFVDGRLVLTNTGVQDVARFLVRNLDDRVVMPNGVQLTNVSQGQPLASFFQIDVVRGTGTETACVGRVDRQDGDLGCSYPLSQVLLDPQEEIIVVVRIQTPASGTWPNGDRFFQAKLSFRDEEAFGSWFPLVNSKPTVNLASGSPSGAGVPGLAEVMRFNVAVDSSGTIFLNSMTFLLEATDNAQSGWKSNLLNPTRWEIYDIDDPADKLDFDASWNFQSNTNGTVTALLNSFQNALLPIDPGTTRTFVVRIDTTGAAGSDTIRVVLNNMGWADGSVALDSYYVNNMPVEGGTISY